MNLKHLFAITLTGLTGVVGAQLRTPDSIFEVSSGIAFPVRLADGNSNFGQSYGLGIRLLNSSHSRVVLEGHSSIYRTSGYAPYPSGGYFYDLEQWQSAVQFNVYSQPSGGDRYGSGVWFGGGVGVVFVSFRDAFGLYSNESARLGFNLQAGVNFNANSFGRFRYEAPFDQKRTNLTQGVSFDLGYRF